MIKTAIYVNGFPSKDNPNLRFCRKNKIPANYVPVSKKLSKGLIAIGFDDTPDEDVFTSGNLVLCTKEAPKEVIEKKVEIKKKKGDK